MKVTFREAIDFLMGADDYWINGSPAYVRVRSSDDPHIWYHDETIQVMPRDVTIEESDVKEIEISRNGYVDILLNDGTTLTFTALDRRKWK